MGALLASAQPLRYDTHGMTLRAKTLLFIGTIFAMSFFALAVLSNRILLDDFDHLERQQAERNVLRVLSALEDDIAALRSLTLDWAAWDDTYAFMQDKNAAYIQSNLGPESSSAVNNRWNFMLYVDAEGGLFYEKGTDLAANRPISVPDELKRRLSPGDLLLSRSQTDLTRGISGLLSLADTPLLIASQPILTSAQSGPARGSLICARQWNAAEIEKLSRTTLVSLHVHRLNDPKIPADFQQALSMLSDAHPTAVITVSEGVLAGYALLKDIYGQPSFILKAEISRDIHRYGRAAIRRFNQLRLATLLFILVFTLLLLERLVLSRLSRLVGDLKGIEGRREASVRVHVDGADELGQLARAVNNALEFIEKAQEEQLQQQERYRSIIAQATEAIALVDARSMRFVEANAAFLKLLHYTPQEIGQLTLPEVWVGKEPFQQLLEQLRSRQQAIVTEQQYRRKDGAVVDVEASAALIAANGQELLSVVAHDVTQRKQESGVLQRHNAELSKLNAIMMGREERILELKQEVNSLLQQQGKPARYNL